MVENTIILWESYFPEKENLYSPLSKRVPLIVGSMSVSVEYHQIAATMVALHQIKETETDPLTRLEARNVIKKIDEHLDLTVFSGLLLIGDGPSDKDLQTMTDKEIDEKFFRSPEEARKLLMEMTGGYAPEGLVEGAI